LYINHFLSEIKRRLQTQVKGISDEALRIMMNYRWPGDVRELANILEQSVLNATQSHFIQPENLPPFIVEKDYQIGEEEFTLKSLLREAERQIIKRALNFTHGNKRKAAKLLEIQRCVLYQKLKRYPELSSSNAALRATSKAISSAYAGNHGLGRGGMSSSG